jgi:hypothetical protein
LAINGYLVETISRLVSDGERSQYKNALEINLEGMRSIVPFIKLHNIAI